MPQAQTRDDDDFIEGTEVDLSGDNELDIEVIDDTPAEDRNRKPLKTDALAAGDDEAEGYSDGVKKRLGELRHQAHDERREKERALRERDEAIRVAQESFRKTKALQQQLTYGEASFATESTEKAALAVQAAKAKHREAYEAGDPDAMAEATAEIAAASQAMENAKRWSSTAQEKIKNALQQEKDEVDSEASQRNNNRGTPITPDARATEWTRVNPWFGSDPEMTSLAYGLHERLWKSGVHPEKDADKYYSEIDASMRKRFPEYEWPVDDDAPAGKKSTAKKTASVVAPVTRTPRGNTKKTVKLSTTQVRMAEKLGLTLEQYARELVKIEEES